jgi:hypothetical protein
MAKRWAVGNGNWNTAATWNDPGGGATVPSPGDTCHANGYTVTIDVDLTGTAYELRTTADGAPPAAGGVFTTSGTRTIYANCEAGTTTCLDPASATTLYGTTKGGASATARGAALTNNQSQIGNSTGGSVGLADGTRLDPGATQTGNSIGGGASDCVGTRCQGGIQTGNSAPGTSSGGHGTYCRDGGVQNGNSAAGTTSGAHGTSCGIGGIQNGNSVGGGTSGSHGTSVTTGGIHNGNATGGSASGSHGTSVVTTGKAFIALATGTTAGAFGVQSAANVGNCVIVKATSGSYATDIGAGTDTGLTNHPFVNVLAVWPTAAQVLDGVPHGNAGNDRNGTYVEAAAAKVEYGVTFGPSSSYTGTLVTGGVIIVEDD